MQVAARPLPNAAFQRLCDKGEIGVFKIQPQFFDGIGRFRQRVVPSQRLVTSFFVVDIFNDILGMAQGPLQFMARHGENAAQPMGHGLQLGREVG